MDEHRKRRQPDQVLHQRSSLDSVRTSTSQILTSLSKSLPQIEKIAHLAWKAVSFESLPEWLRDNEYLQFHHRPPMYSIRGCIKSIFRLHTETWNIWTHLVGFLFFVILTLSVYCFRDHITHLFEDDINISDLPWQEQFVIFLFFLSAMSCLFCSTAFHVLCNHSEHAHSVLSRLDYSGIAILITGSSIPSFYYFFYCSGLSRDIHISVIMILCTVCIVVSLWSKFDKPKYRPLRFAVFVSFGLYAVIPATQMFFSVGFKEPFSSYVIGFVLMGSIYIVGASLYVLRIPERFFPGWFDVWAHSHQLFHICVVMATLVHYDTLLLMVHDRFDMGNDCSASIGLLVQ